MRPPSTECNPAAGSVSTSCGGELEGDFTNTYMSTTDIASASQIRNGLSSKLVHALTELVEQNIDGIAHELTTAEDGSLSVSFGIKLKLFGKQVDGTGTVSYRRVFRDEITFATEDPDQPGLPLEGETVEA